MDQIELGGTGIRISRLALGCGTFGGVGSPATLIGHGLDEAAAFATMDEAAALGITLFDTACSYAGGASESMIGRWLARRPAALRQRIRICTKLGTVVSATGIEVDLSPANLERQLNASLERLGVAQVDLCMSHAPDDRTPIAETLEGFAALIEAGKVSAIGACNITAAQLQEALFDERAPSATALRLGAERLQPHAA
jgi:aryl-alcohol dehydrogenase-like predicted oxidoreductase